MRDELGGRVSALNSTFNGNTSNAAPHSAAGLANGFVEALNDLLGISESEEPEEGATDEAITAAAENLGTLSNKREVDEEDEEALSALSEAINNFGETLGLNLSGDDPASETEAVEDSLEPEASPADAIASQTIDVINNKDGIGLGQEDLEASDDEDDPEFPGE